MYARILLRVISKSVIHSSCYVVGPVGSLIEFCISFEISSCSASFPYLFAFQTYQSYISHFEGQLNTFFRLSLTCILSLLKVPRPFLYCLETCYISPMIIQISPRLVFSFFYTVVALLFIQFHLSF
jgi:hypothetical protein